jgi:hypothetical protein
VGAARRLLQLRIVPVILLAVSESKLCQGFVWRIALTDISGNHCGVAGRQNENIGRQEREHRLDQSSVFANSHFHLLNDWLLPMTRFSYYFPADTFFGDFSSRTDSNSEAEAGALTALSTMICVALTFLP